MKARLIGAVVLGVVGFLIGEGSGIVGGVIGGLFGGVAGVFVFSAIGAAWGFSAGPDLAGWWRRRRSR